MRGGGIGLTETTTGKRKPRWIRILIFLAVVAGGALLARIFGLTDLIRLENLGRLREWIASFGPAGPLLFILGYILAVIFFVPGLPITVLAGVAFGPIWGTAYVSVASVIGASAAFLIARHAARDMVEAWVQDSPRFQAIDQAVAQHGWRIVMLTRLVPLFPFNLQNYVYGLTRITFGTYVLTSWICMLPGTAAYTFTGGALSEGGGDIRGTLTYLAIAGVLFVLVSLIPYWLRRRSSVAKDLLERS